MIKEETSKRLKAIAKAREESEVALAAPVVVKTAGRDVIRKSGDLIQEVPPVRRRLQGVAVQEAIREVAPIVRAGSITKSMARNTIRKINGTIRKKGTMEVIRSSTKRIRRTRSFGRNTTKNGKSIIKSTTIMMTVLSALPRANGVVKRRLNTTKMKKELTWRELWTTRPGRA